MTSLIERLQECDQDDISWDTEMALLDEILSALGKPLPEFGDDRIPIINLDHARFLLEQQLEKYPSYVIRTVKIIDPCRNDHFSMEVTSEHFAEIKIFHPNAPIAHIIAALKVAGEGA